MTKRIIFVVAALFSLAGFCKEYTAGKYAIDLGETGGFHLMYDGDPVCTVPGFIAHDAKWQWQFGGGRFRPQINVKKESGNMILTLTSAKPGVAEKYVNTIKVTPNGVFCSWCADFKTTIAHIDMGPSLPEGLYSGQKYCIDFRNGKRIYGAWKAVKPAALIWNIFGGNDIRTAWFMTENDLVLKAEMPQGLGHLTDTRTAKEHNLYFTTGYANVKPGKWKFDLNLTVFPAAQFPTSAEPIQNLNGKYGVNPGQQLDFKIFFNGKEVAAYDMFQMHNAQWQWIIGGPGIKAKKSSKTENGIITLSANADHPGILTRLEQKVSVSGKGVDLSWQCKIEKNVHDLTRGLFFPEDLVAGQAFCYETSEGKRHFGKWDKGKPSAPRWNLTGQNNMKRLWLKLSDGQVLYLVCESADGYLWDTRAVKGRMGFSVSFQKKTAGTELRLKYHIEILPGNQFPKDSPAGTAVSAVPAKKKGVVVAQLDNKHLAVQLNYRNGEIEELLLKVPDAHILHQGSFDFTFNPVKKRSNPLQYVPKTIHRSAESAGIEVCEIMQLKDNESRLSFTGTVFNHSGKTFNDTYIGNIGWILPGRIEREYNLQGFAAFLNRGKTPEVFRVVEQWGELQRKADAIALYDKELKTVFVVSSAQSSPFETISCSIGRQDIHGGRDRGKRIALQWKFMPFQLADQQKVSVGYEWKSFTGMPGIIGLNGNLAVDARLITSAVKPGGTAVCRFSVSSCGPVNDRLVVTIRNGNKILVKEMIPVQFSTPGSLQKDFQLPVVANTKEFTVTVNDTKALFAITHMPVDITGSTVQEMLAASAKLKKDAKSELEKLPWIGAETPQSLTHFSRLMFHLDCMEKLLRFDDLIIACGELAKAQAEWPVLKQSVVMEKKNPAKPALRSMKDIKTANGMKSKGNAIYTPEGIRFFIQGTVDSDQLLDLPRIFYGIKDPKNEIRNFQDWKTNLANPRLRKLLIDHMITCMKQYGNAHSQYFKIKNYYEPLYHQFLSEYFQEMEKQGIWVSFFMNPDYSKWDMWNRPEVLDAYERDAKKIFEEMAGYSNITHTVIPSPEPVTPTPGTTPDLWKEFRKWYDGKYGIGALAKAGYLDDSKLPNDVLSETPAPISLAYSQWIGEILVNATERLLKFHKRIGSTIPLYLGYSVWACWPINESLLANRYINDPRIKGTCLDNYLGHYWGAESNPPETAWTGDLQFSRKKPLIMGEWGSGAAMPNTSWKYGFESHRQSFGRQYFGRSPAGMYAWSITLYGWCNMFDRDAKPLPVTQEFCNQRDMIIANSVSQQSEILCLAAQMGTPKFIDIAQLRVNSSLPLVGIFPDFGDYRELKTWDLSGYKVIILFTEGVPADVIASLKKFPGKVILLGRPATHPDQPDAAAWVKAGLFIKNVEAKANGGAVPRRFALEFTRTIGTLQGKTKNRYNFAATYSAWLKESDLLPEVKILAKAKKSPVLLQQGNLYWFTDMLGIGNLDMPASRCVPYPAIQKMELELLSALLNECGIKAEPQDLLVRIVNDAAVCYDPLRGHVFFRNADAFKLPAGIFPRAYEQFTDGVVLLTGGKFEKSQNLIEIRCKTDKIKRVTVDGRTVTYKKLAFNRIAIELNRKGYAVCDIRVCY